MGFSSPVQASFFLVCMGDSMGTGYHPCVMPRSALHYHRCTVTCGCKKKNALENVSATSLVFRAQYFASATKKNVVPKFTHRLSQTLCKIYKYKCFLSHIFPYMDREWLIVKKFLVKYLLITVLLSKLDSKPMFNDIYFETIPAWGLVSIWLTNATQCL